MTTNRLIRFIASITLILVGGFLIGSSSLYMYLTPKLPSTNELKDVQLQIPLKIVTSDRLVIREFGEKKRTPVEYDEIPQYLIDALLAAEDDNFFKHRGIDYQGLIRSTMQLITEGRIVSGGSTITMQVARNFFLNRKQEFSRKFNEILLALRIESELSKPEILSLYVNKMFLGKTAYGFGAAAQIYYGKNLNQLSLAQIAMLAGVPKAPSTRNPISNPEKAMERRNWILSRMLKLGSINSDEFNEAVNEVDEAKYFGSTSEVEADYVAEMVRQEVITKFGLDAYTSGYTAITTIDSRMQSAAIESVKSGVNEYDLRHGYRGAESFDIPENDWIEVLANAEVSENKEPAIVTDVFEDRILILTKSGSPEILSLNDLNNLKIYVDASTTTKSTELTNLFNRGDLIRIVRDDTNKISIAQIPNIQAALIAMNPQHGGIKALVGGYNFKESSFNRVTQASRQPGSNFKPFIYATALTRGFTPASIINDSPIVFNDEKLEDTWRPENDGGKFYGPTRLREALYRSRNLVSIRLLRRLGIDSTLEGLQNFGFNTSEMPLDLSLALGSHALTPLEIATGYSTFANRGYEIKPFILDRVEDRNGKIIFQANPKKAPNLVLTSNKKNNLDDLSSGDLDKKLSDLFESLQKEQVTNSSMSLERKSNLTYENKESNQAKRVMDLKTAFQIDSMLKDVINFGTGRKAKVLDRTDIAGKTGTTNGPRDAWFSGYSPHLVATSWVGFDDNSLLGRNEYGGSSALPIWINFMRSALANEEEISFDQPEGISIVKIDPVTGKRVLPGSKGIFEYFKTENIPEIESQNSSLIDSQEDLLPDDIL